MISLGEMIAYLPLPGGQIMLAERFVDEAWAFTLGWIYCASHEHFSCTVDDLPPPKGSTGLLCSPPSSVQAQCSFTFGKHSSPFNVHVEPQCASRTTKVNDAVWVTIFLVVIITINLFGAGQCSTLLPRIVTPLKFRL